jgi:hypothetical protein
LDARISSDVSREPARWRELYGDKWRVHCDVDDDDDDDNVDDDDDDDEHAKFKHTCTHCGWLPSFAYDAEVVGTPACGR